MAPDDDDDDLLDARKDCGTCVFWQPDPVPAPGPGQEPAGSCRLLTEQAGQAGQAEPDPGPSAGGAQVRAGTAGSGADVRTDARFSCALHDASPDPDVEVGLVVPPGADLLLARATRDAAVPLLRGVLLGLADRLWDGRGGRRAGAQPAEPRLPGRPVKVDLGLRDRLAVDGYYFPADGYVFRDGRPTVVDLIVDLKPDWLDTVHRPGWSMLDGCFVVRVDRVSGGRPSRVAVVLDKDDDYSSLTIGEALVDVLWQVPEDGGPAAASLQIDRDDLDWVVD